jgi:hypothetical protein
LFAHPEENQPMTLSRTTLGLAVLINLAIAVPSTLHAEEISVTLNEFATRIPISFIPSVVMLSQASSFYFCRFPGNPARDIPSPENLKMSLFNLVRGKSAAEIQALIIRIESESDRVEKTGLMFSSAFKAGSRENFADFTNSPIRSRWGTTPQDQYLLIPLTYGQEVTLLGAPSCYTADQVDQLNAEGLRVIREVMRQLAPGQATQKPAAPGIGIGIQKPQ